MGEAIVTLTVRIDRETDGRYIAEVRKLRGCMVYGSTKSEAVAKVRALALRILADEIEHDGRSVTDVHFR